ncbi:MAG TPA: hypothetical protein VHU61_12430 [Solirubrobacteraceae bacterium]|nr:hypothetical protein [Solirubrobacteraceae bacterium]
MDISIPLSDHGHMLSGHSPQTSLKGYAFRPFEDTWPADNRLDQLRLKERPSAAKAARRMLRHWPSKDRQANLIRRLA